MKSQPHESALRKVLSAIRAPAPTRFAPLAGLFVGAVAAALYLVATQLWPSSVALVLSMLGSALLTHELRNAAHATQADVLTQVFYFLLKYSVLLALSAAKLPFPTPLNVPLGLIMTCGYGASRALAVTLLASLPRQRAARLSHLDLLFALITGMAPALLLGIPGLVGLAVATVVCIGFGSYLKSSHGYLADGLLTLTPLLAELSFYLGAQGSWSYVL